MPTSYSAINTVSSQALAQTLADAVETLEPVGVGTFEVEDGSGLWEVAAYFETPPDIAALSVIEALHTAPPFIVSEIPETDWVAKVRRDLPPVEAGRFFVFGSHDADKVPADAIPLRIEAAMAFGTGHHGTTLGCLRALDKLVNEGFSPAKVIDVGCGTAVLAMAAAKIWDTTILASDIDPTAVDVAKANVKANDLEGRVDCVVAAGFDASSLVENAPYDLVFANILKGPLIALSAEMAAKTAQGGFAILSGILQEQAKEVTEVYAGNGYNLVSEVGIGDWSTLTLGRN